MDAPKFDKSRLPSRHVTEGPARAPHRSYFYAMGITEEEIHQPLVGVATCWNEAAPCNIALNRQAQVGEARRQEGGGTPREFTTITVTDGIAMGHEGMRSSLASREAIADTVELTMRGHCYDAIVGLAGCDKSLPGMMMAMVRLNVPSVFIYGGSILPGRPDRRCRGLATATSPCRTCSRRWAGTRPAPVGRRARRSSSASPAPRPAPAAASSPPTPWPASPRRSGSRCSTPPARRRPTRAATSIATASRRRGDEPDREEHPRPRRRHPQERWRTPRASSPAPAARPTAALHLPAIAHEAGIDFDLFDVCDIFHDTPYFVDLQARAANTSPRTCYEVGGVPVVMKELRKAGLLHARLHDRERPDARRGARRHPRRGGRPGDLPRRHADHQDRRRRRPDGQPRPRRRHREGRRHDRGRAGLHRPGPGLRMRGGRLRRRAEARATRRARSSSSATRAPRAARACARCCRPPRRSRARAWARRSR